MEDVKREEPKEERKLDIDDLIAKGKKKGRLSTEEIETKLEEMSGGRFSRL